MFRSRIAGVGSYLPEKILTNEELEKMVDTSDEWITTRSGIKTRRLADKDQASSDLGTIAAERALQDANIKHDEIDLIINSTLAPDMMAFPSTACIIQKNIGALNAAAFDISVACTGFIYSLSIADQFIKTAKYNNILVVASEATSKVIDWTDRDTCVLFGDGAGAVVLSPAEIGGGGIIDFYIKSDGNLSDVLSIPAGGSRRPASRETVENKEHFMNMKGRDVYKAAVKYMSRSCIEILKNNEMTANDIDMLIPHQANIRIIKTIQKRLKIEEKKIFVNLDQTGNTSSATIPIALDQAIKQNKVKKGDKLLFVAAGGGFAYGSVLLEL